MQVSLNRLTRTFGRDLPTLVSLLSPIGHHRRSHIKASKGKRAAKRKRRQSASGASLGDTAMMLDPPPKPEPFSCVDVGFNCITRTLQAQSGEKNKPTDQRRYSMVFVSRGNQTAAFNTLFPQMIATSARDLMPDNKTRLVGFSKPCSDKLSSSLGLARVSSVAIAVDAPGFEALWELVKETVKPVQSNWLSEAESTEYLPTQIKSIETTVGPKKAKPQQRAP